MFNLNNIGNYLYRLTNDDRKWGYIVARLLIIFNQDENGNFTMREERMKNYIKIEVNHYGIRLDSEIEIKEYLQDLELHLLYKLEEKKL